MKLTEESFDEIYRNYAKMLYAYVLSLCHNPTVAEDVVQMTFLRAIEKADTFQGKSKISTWLCRIAKNIWLDLCRTAEEKNIPLDEWCEPVSETDMLQQMIDKEENARMYQCIHELQEPFKEVFMLRMMGNLSFQEIGDIFGKSEVWARVTFYRAKERLREQIKK
ncbi:MAG: RNA polymerase sigma factor [Roseburia sp.]|nr:RNA polymerase sigma factor [Roseburia sp.]